MKSLTFIRSLIGLPLLVCLSSQGHAATLIRIDFEATAGGWGSVSVANGTVESRAANADAVFGTSGSNAWNILTVPSWGTMTLDPSFSNLVNTSTGQSTGVSMSFTGNVSAASGGSGSNQDPSYDYFVLHESGTGGMPSLGYTISGLLPNTQVKLFLYTAFLSNRGYDFTITGDNTTYTVTSGASNGLLVTGMTNGAGQISGTYLRTNGETNIAGLQIYQVPEPASGLFVSAAVAGICVLRRRRGC